MGKPTFLTALVICLSTIGTMALADGPSDAGNSDSNEQTVHAFFQAFNRHDVEAIVALYAPDAYLMSSDFPAPRHGAEGVRKTYSELFAQLPAIQDELKTMIVKGDEGAVEFISTWRSDGTVPAGRLEIATFFKFKNGKIVSDITYFDVPPQ